MPIRRIAAAVVVAGSLVSCGSAATPPVTAEPVAADASPSAAADPWTSCEQETGVDVPPSGDATSLPRLDPAFTPVSVVLCGDRWETVAPGVDDRLAVEQHATDVETLTAALREPDAPPPPAGIDCDAVLISVPWFAVLDAQGRWVRPGVPTGACGNPSGKVRDALDALTLVTVTTRLLERRDESAAAAAGCSPGHKNMVLEMTSDPISTPASSLSGDPFAGAARVRLCLYGTPADGQDFVAGGLLDEERRAAVGALLAAASPADEGCAADSTRFAVLLSADSPYGAVVYVELDGCQRILGDADEALARGGPELVALLQP